MLVDGAHVPGARALDISALGVDWYSANLHKWAHAPRGCGILWAAPDRQAMLHHPHRLVGTRPRLPPRIRAHGHGGSDELSRRSRRHRVAAGVGLRRVHGVHAHPRLRPPATLLADAWGTEFTTPREMIGAMVTVPLPLSAGTTDDEAARLRVALLVEDQIEVQLHAWREPAVGQSFSAGLQRSQRHRTPGAGSYASMRCRETRSHSAAPLRSTFARASATLR